MPRVLPGLVELVNNTDLLKTLAKVLEFLDLDLTKELLSLGLTPGSPCRRLRWRCWTNWTLTRSLLTSQTELRVLTITLLDEASELILKLLVELL